MQERVTTISSNLLFFPREINRLEEEDLRTKLQAPELARYAPWLRDARAFRDHQLSDEVEKLLHEKAVAGRAAWVRLFAETIAALRFPVGGKEMPDRKRVVSGTSVSARLDLGGGRTIKKK